MNVFTEVEARVRAALEALKSDGTLPIDLALPDFEAEPPRDASHGDIAVNAALVLAKAAKMKPRDLAEAIATRLRADPLIEKVGVAGPGFINLALKTSAWTDALPGRRYGVIAENIHRLAAGEPLLNLVRPPAGAAPRQQARQA